MKNDTSDKVKATVNQALGKAKVAVGRMVDDDQIQAEGRVQNAKGSAQKFAGDAKVAIKKGVEGVENRVDQVADKVKKMTKN